MAQVLIPKEVVRELKAIRRDLDYIKEHMVDADTLLTEEERRLIDESMRHEKKGELVSLKSVKKELEFILSGSVKPPVPRTV